MLECKCSGRKNTYNEVCDVVAAIVRESHHAVRREVEIRGVRADNQLGDRLVADLHMMNERNGRPLHRGVTD